MSVSRGRRDPDEFDMTPEEWEQAFERATPTKVVTSREEYERALGEPAEAYKVSVSFTADGSMPPLATTVTSTARRAARIPHVVARA